MTLGECLLTFLLHAGGCLVVHGIANTRLGNISMALAPFSTAARAVSFPLLRRFRYSADRDPAKHAQDLAGRLGPRHNPSCTRSYSRSSRTCSSFHCGS